MMSRKNENEERKKSGEEMEVTRSMRKKERKEQRDSDAGEEVFCL